jgi:hypothetical protein
MSIRTAYTYSDDTNEYLEEVPVCESPREPGKYLPPLHSTFLTPPKIKDNEVAIFNGADWETNEDNRHKIVYDITNGSSYAIDYIGEIKEGYTLLEPAEYSIWDGEKWIIDEAKRDEIIDILVDKINKETDEKIYTGFEYENINFYLSLSNQINYKTYYDDRNNSTTKYPVIVKGGGINDFLQLKNAEELESFYLSETSYIDKNIKVAWDEKLELLKKTTEELLNMMED